MKSYMSYLRKVHTLREDLRLDVAEADLRDLMRAEPSMLDKQIQGSPFVKGPTSLVKFHSHTHASDVLNIHINESLHAKSLPGMVEG